MNNLSRIQKAVKFATKTHQLYQDQKRKGKGISYISHPLTVGLMLSEAGASEDLVIAGILHDTIEDSIPEKKVTREMIAERFGENVASLVLAVTEEDKELSWDERKIQAREHIAHFSSDEVMLKSADLYSNVTEMLDDAKYDPDLFDRFKAGKEKTISNYVATMQAILDRWPENPFAEELKVAQKRLLEL